MSNDTENIPAAESPSHEGGGRMSCGCSVSGRNLVVCIDGTSNQFGPNNTNVIELYSQVIKSVDQLTYYNSGIGTYAKPSWKSWSYMKQVLDNKIDLAIAWNFEKIILAAYRWIVENYQENDRIYLFGFSRGAYQVRTLAGMIQKVGLIHKGNEEQIPFAYELYADSRSGEYVPRQEMNGLQYFRLQRRPPKPKPIDLTNRFKTTFSREDVRVHFVGVWDTVSSVGIFRSKNLPLTDGADHICFFRHALALDERRVKFLPEYVHGGAFESKSTVAQIKRGSLSKPHIKEVWFAGTHSDIGGGNQLNLNLDLGRTPFLWMSYEAMSSGLHLKPCRVEWNWQTLDDVKESLTSGWHVLEWIPFKRLSYKDGTSTTHRLHRGQGRKIHPGQKIHASVPFCKESYVPKARPLDGAQWSLMVGRGRRQDMHWASHLGDIIEMDIFDHSAAQEVIEKLTSGPEEGASLWLHRLAVMTWSRQGCEALMQVQGVIPRITGFLQHWNPGFQAAAFNAFAALHQYQLVRIVPVEVTHYALSALELGKDARASCYAARLLGQIDLDSESRTKIIENKVFSTLRGLLKDENPERAQQCLIALCGLLRYGDICSKAQDEIIAAIQAFSNRQDINNRAKILTVLEMAARDNYLRERLFDTEMMSTLRATLNDDNWSNRLASLLTVRILASHDDLRRRLFDVDMIIALRTTLSDDNKHVRNVSLQTLEILSNLDDLRLRLFDAKTIAALRNTLCDNDEDFKRASLQTLGTLADHDDLRRRLFNAETISALQATLTDEYHSVRDASLRTLTILASHDELRKYLFNAKAIVALRTGLGLQKWRAKRVYLNMWCIAANYEDLREQLCDAESLVALRNTLRHSRWLVREAALQTLMILSNYDDLRKRLLDDVVLALQTMLHDGPAPVTEVALQTLAIFAKHDDSRKRLFGIKTTAALRSTLSHESWTVQRISLQTLQSLVKHDDIRGPLFDAEMLKALRTTLGDPDEDVRGTCLQMFGTIADCDERLINADTLVALRATLTDSSSAVKLIALNMLAQNDVLRERLFDEEMIVILQNMLNDDSRSVRDASSHILTTLITHSP